ncbi:hypothetical protein AAFF_G00317400 [Aldrovandia affinis]|uniref:FH2 domain-containing protein n=1 Tax=Aldrovandia affinis TaxID=143900 RepID=A0AAD7R7Q9_9TELE|nr:hypothetical protein AAFF_G00317400 [Aldrovandia affinis]
MHVMTSLSLANERGLRRRGARRRLDALARRRERPAPPPPPPPPPGGPPPPPPPPPGVGNPAHGLRKKRRVRSFFWKTIPEEKVRGKPNIWTLAVRQQQYQIDVRTVEELFGQQEEVRSAPPSSCRAPRGSLARGGSFKETKDEVSLQALHSIMAPSVVFHAYEGRVEFEPPPSAVAPQRGRSPPPPSAPFITKVVRVGVPGPLGHRIPVIDCPRLPDLEKTARRFRRLQSSGFRSSPETGAISILDSKRGMNVGIFLKQFKNAQREIAVTERFDLHQQRSDNARLLPYGHGHQSYSMSNQSIAEDVRFGNSKPYGSGPLKELLKLLPESEEVRKLRAFKGDATKLTFVDSFMYLLIQVPSFDVRIEAMVLKEEFSPCCSVMSHDIDVIRDATKGALPGICMGRNAAFSQLQTSGGSVPSRADLVSSQRGAIPRTVYSTISVAVLMTCEELHAVLHLVLQAGNIMNAGGYAGNAVGFKLSSLLSLADTKANKPGMNLLHFVALEAQKKDESLLKFPEKLQHVQSAVRISVENIEAEFESLYVRTRMLEEKIQRDAELLQQLDLFLQVRLGDLGGRRSIGCVSVDRRWSSTRMLQDLKKRRLDLRKEGNALIDFFCEDKDTFKLDDCFRIFQDFCLKFKKAVKDNVERKLKEEARQRRLHELEERRSAWGAGAGARGGAGFGFGRSSSENDVETLTKEGLLDFLQQRPLSPHSPLSRSSSARRHRHTMAASAAADRQLQSYLELFGTDAPAKFNSLPRPGRPHHRRTAAWLLSQDGNRELGPKALLPLARPSAYFNNNEDEDEEDDPRANDNELTTVSEGGVGRRTDRNRNVFQRAVGAGGVGGMNVTVERCTLVPGLQHFDGVATADNDDGNNNNNNAHLAGQGGVVVTDLEREREREREREPPKTLVLDTPPSSRSLGRGQGPRTAWDYRTSSSQKEEEEDSSTVSSTTCDTPLPLDTPASNRKPIFYIVDCTDTDCSVMLDLSELDHSPIRRDPVEIDVNAPDTSGEGNPQDQRSLSPNRESATASEPSESKSAPANEPPASISADDVPVSVCPSADTEEAASDSCDAPEDKPPAPPKSPRAAHAKTKPPSRGGLAGRPTRTRVPGESMRKVVPLTKLSRSLKRPRQAGREERRPSSLPPDESRAQPWGGGGGGGGGGVSRWARDQTPRRPSFRKPSAKPVRNVPKPPPEEKMCRSALRALAQGGPAAPPPAPAHAALLPGFARNTVASSSRTKKDPPAADSNPPTPSKSASLGRTGSLRSAASRAPPAGGEEEKLPDSLRRAQSTRASSRSGQRGAETQILHSINGLGLPKFSRSGKTDLAFGVQSVAVWAGAWLSSNTVWHGPVTAAGPFVKPFPAGSSSACRVPWQPTATESGVSQIVALRRVIHQQPGCLGSEIHRAGGVLMGERSIMSHSRPGRESAEVLGGASERPVGRKSSGRSDVWLVPPGRKVNADPARETLEALKNDLCSM